MSIEKQIKSTLRNQPVGVIAIAAVQFSLTIAGIIDIIRRPKNQIKGSKWAWLPFQLVNFIGPLTYFFFGRKKK